MTVKGALAVRVTEIPRILAAFYGTKRTAYFRGQPGCGKTDLVHLAASEISASLATMGADSPEVAVYELHLASMSEVDIRGYLIPDDKGSSHFTSPVFASFVAKHPRGILFLDEFPQAPHEVQKAVAPLLLNGSIGEYTLPPAWMVVCAGNREEDNAGVNNMLSHVINRMSIIDVNPPDVDDWTAWAAAAGMSPEVVAFAKIEPGAVFGEPDLSAGDQPYCTPRSLHAMDAVAQRWPGGIGAMINDTAGLATIQGFIGAGATAGLRAVLTLTLTLPSYEDVIANPERVVIPEKPNEAYASLMMIALRAKEEHSGPVVKFIARFQPNFAVVGFSALLSRNPAFMREAALGEWVRANSTLVQKVAKYIRGK
jgi:hypothetical protein